MWKRKAMLAALALASIGVMPLPASAETRIFVDVAPPAPRHEVVPIARPGFVWAPGYWDWRNGRHVWVKGHWVRERKGYYWHPNRWEQRDGRWYFERGRWDRERYARWDERRGGMGDKDHDGVPNRFDRDRDGDGVPNRFDSRPDNPRRH
jgi:WXXGXW repeat (2 copies)